MPGEGSGYLKVESQTTDFGFTLGCSLGRSTTRHWISGSQECAVLSI